MHYKPLRRSASGFGFTKKKSGSRSSAAVYNRETRPLMDGQKKIGIEVGRDPFSIYQSNSINLPFTYMNMIYIYYIYVYNTIINQLSCFFSPSLQQDISPHMYYYQIEHFPTMSTGILTQIKLVLRKRYIYILGDPEGTTNKYCKSHNLPNMDM